ncbi:MAG: hypothetical protein GX428_00880 [Candidatus Atribacteria bacterium]|nr:hypothetical protein [Candidatus Atribacteria bacterium]
MVYFFLILTMVFLILFIIGMINPSLVIFHFKKRRFLVIFIYGTLALISFIVLIITSPPPQPSLNSNNELPSVTKELSDQNMTENGTAQQSNQFSTLDWLKESEKYFSPKKPEPEQYVLLSISLVTRFDQVLEIIGETDLPNGSILEIQFRQLSTPKYPYQFDLQTYTLVQSNEYQATFHAPENFLFSQGPFQIRVSFSPENQIPAIQKLVGKNGEKIKGKKSRVENQTRILEDIKEVSFEFEINPSPPR